MFMNNCPLLKLDNEEITATKHATSSYDYFTAKLGEDIKVKCHQYHLIPMFIGGTVVSTKF